MIFTHEPLPCLTLNFKTKREDNDRKLCLGWRQVQSKYWEHWWNFIFTHFKQDASLEKPLQWETTLLWETTLKCHNSSAMLQGVEWSYIPIFSRFCYISYISSQIPIFFQNYERKKSWIFYFEWKFHINMTNKGCTCTRILILMLILL